MRTIFRFFMTIAVYLYRATGGRFGGRVQGLPVLLLTSTGRKTGKKRTTPLGFFEHDGGFVISASNAGFDRHPAWYHNLTSNPEGEIEIKDQVMAVRAEVVGSPLRDELWRRLIEIAPGYANYARRTQREIPLVLLRPQKGQLR